MSPDNIAQIMTVFVGIAAGFGIAVTFLQLLSEACRTRKRFWSEELSSDVVFAGKICGINKI